MISFPSGNTYKLVYLDTNAINEISKNTNNSGKKFLEKYADGSYMFCTSVFNLYELSKTKGKSRNKIIDVFGVLPLGIIELFPHLIEFEKQANEFNKEMIMFAIGTPPLFKVQLKTILDLLSQDNEFKKSIETMNENFRKELKFCNSKDRKNSNWQSMFKENMIGSMNESLSIYYNDYKIEDLGKYWSLEILTYIKNQFVFNSSKEIRLNSIIDAYNASILPYVEVYVTERTVGSWLEMAKSRFEYIKDKEIVKIAKLYD